MVVYGWFAVGTGARSERHQDTHLTPLNFPKTEAPESASAPGYDTKILDCGRWCPSLIAKPAGVRRISVQDWDLGRKPTCPPDQPQA